ncbi:MAG: redoxin family protein [Planctomycetes bacterium]|nr:redoxin family protein [Planctomycetota bacterium]
MRLPIVSLMLLASLFAGRVMALELGSPAPALEKVTWVKGAPVAVGKTITVVEFWATWCGPCKKGIPHLTKLQKTYGDKVAVVGLSSEEEDAVRPFVEKMGAEMDYHVGIMDQEASQTYMDGVSGIPHSFLIDAAGTVVWAGHPMGLDKPLADVVAGTFDAKRYSEVSKLEDGIQELVKGGVNADNQEEIFTKALEMTDRILAIDAVNANAVQMRMAIAQMKEDKGLFRAILEKLPRDQLGAEQANELAADLATKEDLAMRNLDLALAFAARAVELEPKEASYIDTRARILCELGMTERAIALEQQAIALEPENKKLGEALDYFRTVEKLRAGLTEAK